VHELSIAQGLCTQLGVLAREHGASRIHRVEIDVGALSNVVPNLLRQAFEVLQESIDLITQAKLVIHEIPLVVACAECKQDHELKEFIFQCPDCGSTRLDVRQGEDLLLRQVELETEEHAE
jgi:hydrogenase nickel incorporation protein HypA/HybF